jgi:hypothetical protein
MAFTDWEFFSRITEQTIPSNIQFLSETGSPLAESASLNIADQGAPERATVAATLKGLLFPTILTLGRIRTIFERKTGSGFRDQGFYFLASGRNPTLDGVTGYTAHIIDGSSTLRVSKFTNGLHDITGFSTITSFTTTTTGSDESVVMESEWFGGFVSDFEGFTQIETRFANNTIDFSNLIDLSTIEDSSSPFTVGYAGVWVRSRNSSEPLDALVDNTTIYKREFV